MKLAIVLAAVASGLAVALWLMGGGDTVGDASTSDAPTFQEWSRALADGERIDFVQRTVREKTGEVLKAARESLQGLGRLSPEGERSLRRSLELERRNLREGLIELHESLAQIDQPSMKQLVREARLARSIALREAVLQLVDEGSYLTFVHGSPKPPMPEGRFISFEHRPVGDHGGKMVDMLAYVDLSRFRAVRDADDHLCDTEGIARLDRIQRFNTLPLAERKGMFDLHQQALTEWRKISRDRTLSRDERRERSLELKARMFPLDVVVDSRSFLMRPRQ